MFGRKINCQVYTSYYQKMFTRKKESDDVYIQVSRTLGRFERVPNYIEKIDENWGEIFGNFAVNLEAYERFINKKGIRKFYKHLKELDGKRIFLLCFENLNDKYTIQDEKRYPEEVKAGENKKCHRTILAKKLNEKYKLGITEYNGE